MHTHSNIHPKCVCVCVIHMHVCAFLCVCVSQTLALAVPVWGGPLVLANSVWSYLLCFMFLASWGHKQPFVAKRCLVSLQTDPCSCSPLLDISMCVRACVCGGTCVYLCLYACGTVPVCANVAAGSAVRVYGLCKPVGGCIRLCMYSVYV